MIATPCECVVNVYVNPEDGTKIWNNTQYANGCLPVETVLYSSGSIVYYSVSVSQTCVGAGYVCIWANSAYQGQSEGTCPLYIDHTGSCVEISGKFLTTLGRTWGGGSQCYTTTNLMASCTPFTSGISGDTCGVDTVALYGKVSDTETYIILDNINIIDDHYQFMLGNNTDYKLIFSDGHEYEFSYIDTAITYDYSICNYITLNFKDNCGNLLPETWGRWYTPNESFSNLFHTSSGSYDILYDNPDYLELQVFSAIGKLWYNIANPQETSYTILNDKIAWHNNIYINDGNTSAKIEDALVTFSQDCIIDSSIYPVRQKYSNADGYACFGQCELDMAYITVTATGYKPLSDSISPIHLDAFNLGQTTIATLYPVDDPTNESTLTESGTIATTYIYFQDNSSHHTNSILDTDEYVDLYYYNNNSESAAMTLKFRKYNIYTGFIDLLSWNIPHDTSGYKRIYNANFSDHTYSYRGYLYNVEIDGWNRIKHLSVRNETKEEIDHYQNLSTNLWFVNKNQEGSIDFREDLSIVAYANSDNSSLLEISLELYNNSVYVDHINLTWADFVSADTKWFYEWEPDHAYVDEHNYTVRMHGYDYYLLKTDFINASDYRKNKLTIIVKDRAGNNLNNAYIFLEGYGSLSTGISYYNSYEGLDNGDYRYKASKSGYTGAGWDNVNLTEGDEIVAYILTSDTGNTTYIPIKTSDADIQSFFFPMMFILFIFILMGAFRYVCS
jgi:hypothetical protein